MKVRIIGERYYTIEMPCVPRVGETIYTKGWITNDYESPELTVTHVIYNISTDERGKVVYDGVDVYARDSAELETV